MRIFFDNADLSGVSNSGPNSFARRLAIALSHLGHQLADPDDYDVALTFIEASPNLDRNRPYVHRLDGIWFHPNEIRTKNEGIMRTYANANRVVFQSQFDRMMVEKWFGAKGSQGTVIRNGIELQALAEVSPDVLDFKRKYGKIFVSSSSWHGQKRLKSNIELYLHLKRNVLKDERCCLIVLGPHPDCIVAGNDIYYANSWVSHETCLQIYSISNWMIHLAYLDHSPNVVVEAISRGCPVICSSEGGTKELVAANGLVLPDRKPYDFEPCEYDSPPAIDVGAVESLPNIVVDPMTVDIRSRARAYESVLLEAARLSS